MTLEEQFEKVCAKFLYKISKLTSGFETGQINADEFQNDIRDLTIWMIEKEKQYTENQSFEDEKS